MLQIYNITSNNPSPTVCQVPDGATVINLATDARNRVWVSNQSGPVQLNGYPLEPFAATTKNGTGSLYLALDAAAISDVKILITDVVSGYDNPIALAAAVAAELLLTGIPNVLVDTQIANAIPILHGGSTTFDISGYASIYVSCTGNRLNLQQYDVAASIVDEYDYSYTHPVRLAVVAGTLKVTNTISAGTSNVTIWGSNRQSQQRFDGRYQDTTGDLWQTIGGTFVAGGVALGHLNASTSLQGAVHATFHVTGLVVQGYFYLSSSTLATILICDTTEMFTGSNGDRYLTRQIAVPAGSYTIGFFCTTGGNATIDAALFQDGN